MTTLMSSLGWFAIVALSSCSYASALAGHPRSLMGREGTAARMASEKEKRSHASTVSFSGDGSQFMEPIPHQRRQTHKASRFSSKDGLFDTVHDPPGKIRVAVIGAGTAGHAAVYFLKKRYGDRFDVSLFEARDRIGGVVTSTKWGSKNDWNQGYVDSGMCVSTRFAYPNFFDFLDTERIPTEKRPMKLKVAWNPEEGDNDPENFRGDARDFWKELVKFRGSFEQFARSAFVSKNKAAKWFVHGNLEMWKASMTFLTIDTASSTDHVAQCLEMINITGSPTYEAPLGGYIRYSERAASFADQLHLNATVTRVESRGDAAAVKVSWSGPGGLESATFDSVVITVPPDQIRQMMPDFAVMDSTYPIHIAVHNHSLGGGEAFYEYDQSSFRVTTYPNGYSPPYTTYFPNKCGETCRRSHIPKEALFAEYRHDTWVQNTLSRKDIAKVVQKSGHGGIHFAGVWSADGRFAEGAWVTGLRAALEIAGEDWRTYPFKSDCQRYSFERYAMWHRLDQDVSWRYRPSSCYKDNGMTHPYFKSFEDYESFLSTVQSSAPNYEPLPALVGALAEISNSLR